MRLLSLLVLTFVVILGVSFAILNAETVWVHYYIGKKAVPLSLLILGVLIVGIIIGFVATIPRSIRQKLEIRRLKRMDEH
jgi:putative membrane protein